MRQVFLEKGTISIKHVSEPMLDDYCVLVLVHYSCISSGTELATIANAQQSAIFSNVPQKVKKVLESVAANGIEGTAALIKGKLQGQVQSIGYSCSGVVIDVGSKVRSVRVGDFVACAGAGFANHADVVSVPEHLTVRVSDKKYLMDASMTTIGAIALQGIRRANLQLGETVCVIGLGLLGQITALLAKRAGCKVIGIDLIPERCARAKKHGADRTYLATDDNLENDIALYTDQYGVDATIIAAAADTNEIMQQAMVLTRKKGRVVLVGDVGLGLERNPFYQKEIDFLISCSYGPGRFDQTYENFGADYPYAYVRWTENRNMRAFVEFIERQEIDVNSLISRQVPIEEVGTAYQQLREKNWLGVLIQYNPHEQPLKVELPEKKSEPSGIRFIPAVRDRVRVGIVGAGGFATVRLLPTISKIKTAKINVIVDADVSTAVNVSRQYGAAKALVDDAELFTTDLVDVVVIASPHKFHCDQALRALNQGKAVFLEKPMVTDGEQLTRMIKFLETHPEIPFCVDYNRAFSPYMQKIKETIANRVTPLVVHYRMNVGFIPKEHWIQTNIGAGRIIGEACHIFDLFCFLTNSYPVSVSVEALHSNQTSLFPTDNFSAQIRFADGSLCSLLYTSLGNKELGKERMELFFDSKAIIMDDYEYIAGFGLPKSFDEAGAQDKGVHNILTAFFKQIAAPINKPIMELSRLKMVAELTLTIDRLACEGGGSKELV